MSLPWYMTGAARPDYAKFKGSAKRDREAQARPTTPYTPPALPQSSPSYRPPAPAAVPEYQSTFRRTTAPSWTPQEQVAAQPKSPETPSLWTRAWTNIVNYGSDEAVEARKVAAAEQQKRQEDAAAMLVAARKDRDVTGPFGLQFDPNKVTGEMVTIDPDRNFAGGLTPKGAEQEAADARQARYEASRKAFDQRARQSKRRGRDRKEVSDVLTLEEWNAMSPEQQTAVQFNADLYAAVEADRQNQEQYDPTDEEMEAYNATLEDVFGTSFSEAPQGIEYAPETVGFVQNLDTLPQQDVGSLDDYLKLDVAITAKQVKNIERALQPEGPDHLVGQNELTPAQQRLARAQALTRAQGQINSRVQGELERGKRLLTGMTTTVNNDIATELGAVEAESPIKQLKGKPEVDLVNQYMSFLADANIDMDEVLGKINADLAEEYEDESDRERIYSALVDSTMRAATGEGSWYEATEGVTYRTPQQVATRLGVPAIRRG